MPKVKKSFHKCYCGHCNNIHYSEFKNSGICLVCWKKNREFKLSKADEQLVILQARITALEEDKTALEARLQILEILKAKLSTRIANLDLDVKGIPKSLIRKLLLFVHPDQNPDRQSQAKELTTQLLQIRSSKKGVKIK